MGPNQKHTAPKAPQKGASHVMKSVPKVAQCVANPRPAYSVPRPVTSKRAPSFKTNKA